MTAVVLKLGGSVITRKGTREAIDGAALDRAADAIAAEPVDDLVIVHGGGSFGHPAAAAHGVTPESGTHDATAALDVHEAMKRLSEAVLASLQERDVPALPVHPLSAGHRNVEGALTLTTGGVEAMLAEGFVPVLHGDVVAHRGRGVTILSGDEVAASLAGSLGADRVGLCSVVPGVLDESGTIVPEIAAYGDVADALGGSESTDVTGGMAGKVRELLALDAPAWIFDLDGLPAFLAGGSPGTRVRGDRSGPDGSDGPADR